MKRYSSKYTKRIPDMPVERPSGPASDRQIAFIERHNLDNRWIDDRDDASRVIHDYVNDRRKLWPTEKQKALLRQHGTWRDGMTRGEAFDTIGHIFRISRARTGPVPVPTPQEPQTKQKS